MVGVNVGGLDSDQAGGVGRRRAKSLTKEFGDDLDELSVQAWEALKFLLKEWRGASARTSMVYKGKIFTVLVQLWQIFMSSS